MGRGYGVMCPECGEPLLVENAEMVVEGTKIVVPIRIFSCGKCNKSYRWKSRLCPKCGALMAESFRDMAEPLFKEAGLYCAKCDIFRNDQKNLVLTMVEEVFEEEVNDSRRDSG